MQFRAIAPDLAPMIVNIEDSKKDLFLEVPEGVFSSTLKYQGRPKAFLRDVTGKRRFPVEFPDSNKMLLVILYLGSDSKPSSIVLENNTNTSPDGSLRVVNVSNEPLRIEAGDETSDLAPEGNKVFYLAGKRTVFVKITRPVTGEVILSNNWALAPGARTLAVLGSGAAESSGVRVYRFTDAPTAKK